MKFLFATLQYIETDFYAEVGRRLCERGHKVAHLTYSRRAAVVLRRRGEDADCLPDLMNEAPVESSWRDQESRIVAQYPIPSLHDVYRTDPSCRTRDDEEWCLERTIRHFLAIERLVDRVGPDFVVPEVGNETMRMVADLVGQDRGATTLFLMYTLFDDPLRLYANTMDAPIVPPSDLRELTADEQAELDGFVARYTARDEPIREYRRVARLGRLRAFARHIAVRAIWDRDNDYLRPLAWLARDAGASARALALRFLYEPQPEGRPFVYFPLQVTDDYKIVRLRPHCVHQESIVAQLAEALPPGVDLVIKEHPMSIGRNSVSMLRRLRALPNVRLTDPRTSSLDLIRRGEAVATISSTVGLEALMLGKPALTIGRPFYAGYGVTVDLESFDEIPAGVSELLRFRPDRDRARRFLHAAMRRCYPGAPVLVDRSGENASKLAATLDRVARGSLGLSPLAEGGEHRSAGQPS